jgi:membrane fusion protein (multidrug efflux system)
MNLPNVNQMSSSRVLTLVLMCVFSLQACMDQANGSIDSKAAGEDKKEEIIAIPVETATVRNGDVAAFYSGTTTIEADEQAVVVSQITGVVLEIKAEEGEFVKAGQLLVRVEPDRYRLEVERNQAALKRLETDYQRKKELFDRKLVSAEDFERVSAEFDAQKAQVALARLDLKYTDIKAPISGFVSERKVRVGNLVELHQPVYTITSYDPLLAVLHVPERELGVLRLGLEVTIRLDAFPQQEFKGAVIRISPVIDPATGTFRVTTEVRDPNQHVKPGLFGRVDIMHDMRTDVPLVPRSAAIKEDEQTYVFVVGEDQNVSRRSIRTGYERNGSIEVIEGLVDGETVVTAGKSSLSDGSKVEVVSLNATSPKA